jgi:integrase
MLFNLEHLTVRTNGDGTQRYYFRRRGQPLCRMPGAPMSEEFMAKYRECEAWVAPHAGANEGTFAWICDQYMDSPAFKSKAQATRDARRRVIATMVAEPIDPSKSVKFGAEKAKSLTAAHIEVLRDRKAANPNAANERLKILGQIFKLAVSKKWVEINIIRDRERLSVPKGGHRTATDEDLAAYFKKHASGPAWVAGMILKHTGVRVSDLRILGLQNVKKGLLVFETVKTGVLCELPITPEWAYALPRNNMTFLLSDAGKPFESDKSLSQRVSKWFRQAGVEGITAHSVRKWRATKMAEKGTTEFQLMASFGWKDPKEARPYVQAANRQKMAQEASDKMAGV